MDTNPTAPTSATPVQNPTVTPTTPLQSPTVVANPSPKKRFGMSKKWLLIILVLLGLVAIAGAGGFYFMNQNKTPDVVATPTPTPAEVACTMDVKECSDGSFVSRQGPTCEFAACPTGSASSSAETADLKTYSDTVNKISFEYPSSWTAKKAENWTFSVFLDAQPFEFCDACEFMTPIQIGFNEAMDTVTDKKYYSETSLTAGEKRFKELLDPATVKVQKLTVGGKQAVQITGVGAPGPLEGMDFKYTLIQMDNKLLIVDVSEKDYFDIYDQVLKSIKFN